MSEPTKEQIAAVKHQATVEQDHLTLALVQAYDERGREIERLRAEVYALGAEKVDGEFVCINAERAERAEARLEKVVEAGNNLTKPAGRLQRYCEKGDTICFDNDSDSADAERYASYLAAWDAALAAAQPEEDTFDARLKRSWLPAAQPEEESR